MCGVSINLTRNAAGCTIQLSKEVSAMRRNIVPAIIYMALQLMVLLLIVAVIIW